MIKTIIIIVIALVILGYFGFNVTDIVNTPTVQSNLHAAWDFALKIWTNYLAAPLIFFWDKFVIGILWNLIKVGLTSLGVQV